MVPGACKRRFSWTLKKGQFPFFSVERKLVKIFLANNATEQSDMNVGCNFTTELMAARDLYDVE